MFSNVLNKNTITWVRQQQKIVRSHISWISLLGGLDTRADLLSGSSAWALALELVSTGTGSALKFVSTDTGTALELMSTDTGSAWSLWSFLKWEELRVTLRSPPSAVCILWFFFKTFSGTGWYGEENFPVFGCFTNTVSPTCMSESLIGLLLSARVFILSFWWASCSRISAGFKFDSHGTAKGRAAWS